MTRLQFRGPDHAVSTFFRARARAGSPKGVAMGQSGREYAPRCQKPKCKGRRIEAHAKKGAVVQRCSTCQTPWTWTESYTLAGQTHSGRGGRAPASMDTAAELAGLVSGMLATTALPPGSAWLYVQWIGIGSKSIRAVADDASRARIADRHWTKWHVEDAIDRSRAWLERELWRRGMLERNEGGTAWKGGAC